MTVVGIVQLIEHNCVELVCYLSQSVAFFIFDQEAAPEFSIPIIETSNCVTTSKSLKNSRNYVGFVLWTNFTGIHLDPLVTKLFDVIDLLLVNIVDNLLSQVVTKLTLFGIFTF